MNFASDNVYGASPEILNAVVAANAGTCPSYGEDAYTVRLNELLWDVFETDLIAFPVITGSAANALALSALCPPHGVVYSHEGAHVFEDECNGPEFFTGGAKIYPVDGAGGKIDPDALRQAMGRFVRGFDHHPQPSALTVTNATEWGTIYQPDEVLALTDMAREFQCRAHMDGTRFANAVAGSGCSPADLTWRAGIDAMSLGATKNGALGAELVIFFDRALADNFLFRRKRAGHTISKLRFLSAQLVAYFEQDHWLNNARHANAMAARLAAGFSEIQGFQLVAPCQANEVFVKMPADVAARLRAAGAVFHDWPSGGENCVRLVTSFAADEGDIDQVLALAAEGAHVPQKVVS